MPDTPVSIPLTSGVVLRSLRREDGPALAAAYDRNRDHLEQWEPARPGAFYTPEYHGRQVSVQLLERSSGRAEPLVLEAGTDVVGRVNLTEVVRGSFSSVHLGYWIDARLSGRGIMTAAVDAACAHARDGLGLHRVQAATLLHNVASQRVLGRAGFERIGTAPHYLRIAGSWQDHALFQRILHD